jgi:hypothetical protein
VPGTAVFLPGPAHAPHRHRDLRRQRWARTVSTVGQCATYLLLPVLAYQVSGSGLWTALTVAVAHLPHLAGPLVLEAVAELPRRRLLVAVDAANAALLASVPIAFSMDALTPAHVLVAAFAAQALFVCFDAADLGPGPPRTRRERLGRPLFSGGSAALLTAPLLAAVLLVLTAVPPLLTVDGVSLVVSALLVRAVARPAAARPAPAAPPPGSRSPSLGMGLRRRLTVVFGRPVDRGYAAACGLHAAAGGAFVGQLAPWLDQDLGVRPVRDLRFGLLLAGWAVGIRLASAVLPRASARLAGAGLLPAAAADRLVTTGVLPRVTAERLAGGELAGGELGRLAHRLGGHRVGPVFLPVSALCLLCCVLAPHWMVAAVALAAWGCAYTLVVLDLRVAEGGVRLLAFGLGWPAGALVGGVIGAAVGPRAGLVVGVLLVAAAAAVAWLSAARPINRMSAAAEREAAALGNRYGGS